VAREEKSITLQARMSKEQKSLIQRAANLRKMAVSDYLRQVLVPMAERELKGADRQVIEMTAVEQTAFWQALEQPVKLTSAQRRLGRILRGEE
jgi:uncharacterized protein (DUF1778 family)